MLNGIKYTFRLFFKSYAPHFFVPGVEFIPLPPSIRRKPLFEKEQWMRHC